MSGLGVGLSGSEMGCCVVCDYPIHESTDSTNLTTQPAAKTIDYITDISGRPLKDLLGGIFTQDYELLVRLEKSSKKNSRSLLYVCDVCFALLEQIDAFEHNLTKLRLDLTDRRGNGPASAPTVSNRHGCDVNGSFPSLGNEGGESLEDVLKTIKQEVDHEGVVSSLRYDEFGDNLGPLRSDIEDAEMKNADIKAEREDPDFRLSGNTHKTSKDNKLDSTLKRRGRRKGSKVESSNHSIVGLKKRQINESEKVKRGQQRDSPLTELERDLAHPDQHLAPTDKSPHDLVSFSSVLVSELQNQVEMLKGMPQIIDSLNTSRLWDLTLFQLESDTLTFGIPGEAWCFECDTDFQLACDKQRHIILAHAGTVDGDANSSSLENAQKCIECDKTWGQEHLGYEHMKKHHKDYEVLEVDLCSDKSPTLMDEEGWLQCKFCGLALKSRFAYWFHVFLRHKKYKGCKCPVCDKDINTSTNFRRHVLMDHGKYKYKCPHCQKFFREPKHFQEHLKDHDRRSRAIKGELGDDGLPLDKSDTIDTVENGESESVTASEVELRLKSGQYYSKILFKRPTKRKESVICPICGKESKEGVNHAKHMLSAHNTNTSFVCGIGFNPCPEYVESLEAFEKHREQFHPDEKEKRTNKKRVVVTCEVCGKTSRGDLFHAKHMLTQHGIKIEMMCKICNLQCESVRALERHRKEVHCAASCPYCGKQFSQSEYLTAHLKTHEERNAQTYSYMCEICSQAFSNPNYLKIHMKKHQEKTIQCTMCPKMFRWESSLTGHMAAAHNAGKALNLKCEYCGKQFADKSNLKNHRYTHTTEKPHHCGVCGRGYIRRDLMMTHQRNCTAVKQDLSNQQPPPTQINPNEAVQISQLYQSRSQSPAHHHQQFNQ